VILRLAVALLAGIVYVNGLRNPFVYDDYHTVQTNDSIVPPITLRGIVLHDVKRPIVNASYAFDRSFAGPSPFGFHRTNVAFHMLNAVLLFQLARALLLAAGNERRDVDWAAFAAAALFAVHPMMTEAVGYISGRSELMCATFLLAALLYGARWMRDANAAWFGVTLICWLAALLSKETAAMLPFLLVVCDWLTAADRAALRHRLTAFHLPLVAFSLTAGMLRLVVLTRVEYPGTTAVHPELVPLALDVIVRYVRLMVLPAGQTIFHSVTMLTAFDSRALLAYATLGGIVGLAWAVRRDHPVAGFGLFAFLLLLMPAAALTVLGSGEPMAEHRVYVASIGWFLAIGVGVCWLKRRAATATVIGRPLIGAALALVILSFGAETVLRNAIWSDPVALWRESVELAPHHPRPRMLLGEALEDGGRRHEAVAEYQTAVRLGPADPVAHLKLGMCLAALLRFDEARAELRETLRLDPGNARAQRSLSLLAQTKPIT
jgi:protein O-mannosyl-transferase